MAGLAGVTCRLARRVPELGRLKRLGLDSCPLSSSVSV